MDYDWSEDISCLREDFGKKTVYCSSCGEKFCEAEAKPHPEDEDEIVCYGCFKEIERKVLSEEENV